MTNKKGDGDGGGIIRSYCDDNEVIGRRNVQWFDLILSGSLIRSQRLSLIRGERHPSMCSARIIIIRVMVVRMWLDSKCAFRERNLRLKASQCVF